MKLYTGKIEVISQEVIQSLTESGEIEVTDSSEAELDVASVLKEYIRVDRELTERAKDVMEIRGLPYSHFSRTKRGLNDCCPSLDQSISAFWGRAPAWSI